MGFEYDPKTGQVIDTYQDKTQPESLQIGAGVNLKTDNMPAGLSLAEKLDWMESATIEQREAELEERTIAGADQAKEQGFGDGWGFLRDIGRGAANSIEALGSDYVDLGLGLTDLAVQGASAATGNGFDGDAVFNDADNPWTKARRERWKTETEAGQVVSDVFRVGVALLTLPKIGIKGIVTGAKWATLGKASTTSGVLGALTRLDKALKAGSGAASVTKAAGITAGLADKGSDLKRASKLIEDGSELSRYSFKQLSKLGAEGNLLTDAWRSTEAVVSGLAKRKLTFKDLGSALAWDAFVAFNAAGEGDDAFDETFTDMLESWGMPNIPVLQSSPLQSNWTAKLKQMSEGLLMGAVFEGVFGMAQIMRYSRAFRKAGPKEQQLLINALDAESSVLGESLAKNLLPPARVNKEAIRSSEIRAGMPSGSALDNYLRMVDTGRIQNELSTETQANLLNYQKGVVEANRAAAVRGASLSTESLQQGIQEVDVQDLGPAVDGTPRLMPRGELADTFRIQDVEVEVIRPSEPTVTPQTFRQAWTDYVRSVNGLPDYEQLLQDGMVKLERLLPPGRVDGIDWMDAMEKDLNQAGIIQATDSLASNMYLQRGLLEGWASVDPETGFPQFNRKLAFDFDKSESIQKQAQKLDDAAELERYNTALADKEAMNPGSMDPAVQARLGTMEGRSQGVPIDTEQATKLADEELGVSETLRQAQVDDVKAQQFDAQETAELDEAALAGIGDDPDSVLVAEMLGQRLDQLPSPTIEKLGARKYGLVDESGEVLEQFSTLKQAKKSLEAEQGRIREAAIARAKRMRDNATDQPQVWTPGGMVGESDVVGKIKFTKTQLKFLEERGLKLPGTNYELSQTQMSEFAKGLRTLADSGQFVGQQKKMLNNMIDRLDVQVKALEPMARARRIVDDTIQQAKKFNNNGEFCL